MRRAPAEGQPGGRHAPGRGPGPRPGGNSGQAQTTRRGREGGRAGTAKPRAGQRRENPRHPARSQASGGAGTEQRHAANSQGDRDRRPRGGSNPQRKTSGTRNQTGGPATGRRRDANPRDRTQPILHPYPPFQPFHPSPEVAMSGFRPRFAPRAGWGKTRPKTADVMVSQKTKSGQVHVNAPGSANQHRKKRASTAKAPIAGDRQKTSAGTLFSLVPAYPGIDLSNPNQRQIPRWRNADQGPKPATVL